jgi:arsenate reductase (thioredoxin)
MPKIVAFVCVYNSCRSQIAEAFFNAMAKGRAYAFSAGIQSGGKVNPTAVAAMREIGIDISGNKPKALTMEMVEKSNRMITMGCGAVTGGICPALYIKTEDWTLEDPKGKSLAEVKNTRQNKKASGEFTDGNCYGIGALQCWKYAEHR